MTDSHESQAEWRDTAAAFVLGALDPLEEQAFRRRMMRDPAIAAYVEHELQPVADELLQAVDPVEPPASLAKAIIDEARADLAAREVVDRSATGRVSRRRERRRFSLTGSLRPAIALAAVAIALAGSFALGRFTADESGPVASQSPNATFEAVAARGASGSVALVQNGERGAAVRIRGLAPNRRGDVYQLWIARGQRVYPSTLLVVGPDRTGAAYVPEDVTDADALMITREPAGGSAQPTSDVLAKAAI